jgi:glycosyltransferase involved in cell wall biosynthesis
MTFSQRVRERLLEHNGLPPEQVRCNPLGVDLKFFYPDRQPAPDLSPTLPTRGLVLLFAAHNFRLKGLPTLLQALARSVAQGLDAQLLVVGDGPRLEAKCLAVRHGVAERVRLLGAVAHADMARLYRACNLLVHPTWSDHCCLVVLEALASGLPVITTARDGASELIEPGVQGLVLEQPGDVGALTNALLLLGDAQRRAAMSVAAAALRPRLDFDAHLRHVMEWLTEEPENENTVS